MKLLLDENLSRRIAPFLQNDFPGSTQVALVGLEHADDLAVWRYARENGFVIVTRDADFEEISALRGHPPQVVWIRGSNIAKSAMLNLLLKNKASLMEALQERGSAVSRSVEDTSVHRCVAHPTVPPAPTFPQRGFTLTEMAVVLVIVALLIGGMMMPLSAQQDIAARNGTEKALAEIREALIGFAAANGRLPCPDTDGDGIEDMAAPVTNNQPLAGQSTQSLACSASPAEGDLPFATLGVARADAWSHRFRYRVTAAFAASTVVWSSTGATGDKLSTSPGFTMTSAGDIDIKTRGDDPSTSDTPETRFLATLASKVPAVIISHGKNGYGARAADGSPSTQPPADDTDEKINVTASTTKILRLSASPASACSDSTEGGSFCEFDDMLIWLSPNILVNRMIAAGRLP